MAIWFTDPLLSLSNDGETFTFEEEWIIFFDDVVVTIEKGFQTDLTSTPWFLNWFLPTTGKHVFAAIVHDYILKKENNWKKANCCAAKVLHSSDVNIFRKYGMIWGINFWAFIKSLFRF